MQPVVTPEEMAAIDRAAPEPVDVLIDRAGTATARAALRLLGGAFAKRVVIVAGKGNNGNDGRAAAAKLEQKGVRVTVIDAADAPRELPPSDLVIDAAYGTGFHGEYHAPDPNGAPVLAVDIPSGVNGLTGEAGVGAVRADATVTFAALKPGLLLYPGRALAGDVEVADIGLDVSRVATHVVEAVDVAAWLPTRPADTHKWRTAVWVVAGSSGMAGAAALAARGAQRAGAGYVRLSTPGSGRTALAGAPIEAVVTEVPRHGWSEVVLGEISRFRAVIAGPGLGAGCGPDIQRLVADAAAPVVVDGDGLTALALEAARFTHASTVLTPHDGEYERLFGSPPDADRIDAARALSSATGATVLLKGPTTIVANPQGDVLLATTGDARLATAGTGDVLSGIIGALIAQGLEPFRAAAAGAWIHGRAGDLGFRRGLVAGDLPELVPLVYASLEGG